MELCRKEFTLQRMQGLVKSGISGIIYIYIYTSFQVETRIKIGREEFRGRSREEFSGHAGSDKRMVLSLFALVLVAVKLNYLVKKATCTEIPYRNVF